MSRARIILDHVAAAPADTGTTFAAIIAAVVGDVQQLTPAERALVRDRVSKQLCALQDVGKLERRGQHPRSTYHATAHTTTDRRRAAQDGWASRSPEDRAAAKAKAWATRRANAGLPPKAPAAPKPAKVPKRAKPARGAVLPVVEVPRAFAAAPAPPPRTDLGPATLAPEPGTFSVARRHGGLTSAEVAADLAAFRAQGGQVERLAPGACSRPLLRIAAEARARGEDPVAALSRRRCAVSAFRRR